jgi:Pyridoxamine 5'-phosphate oxidase
MTDLTDVARLAGAGHHLAVFTVARPDGTVQASVVSAGVIADPVDGSPGVAAVLNGGTRKLALLRQNPQATLVFTHGFDWAAVSGPVRLVGPDDGAELGLDVPATIRSVFAAAGGTHEDWAEFDRVMAADRRCAVFVQARKISSNAGRG